MRLRQEGGQYIVDQIGLDTPLIFPGSMDRQDVARVVMNRYGDQVRAEKEKQRWLGGQLPPEKAATLGAGETGQMLWDFMNKPRVHVGAGGISAPAPESVAPYEQRAQDRAALRPQLQQYGGTPYKLGTFPPYFALPGGAVSRPVQGLLSRLGVESLPGLSRAPELVGRSVVADTAGQGAILGAASDEGTAVEGAAYGAGGGVLGKALSRALKPADTALGPYDRMMLRRGEQLGYQASPARATGSRALKRLEEAMEQNILMAGGGERISRQNQENSNRIVAEALGFRGPLREARITPTMLDQVSRRFNDEFESLTQGQSVNLDTPEFMNALAKMEAENVDYPLYNKDFKDVIHRTVDLIAKNDGWITGEQYQTLSSKLVKGIRAGYKPNSGYGDFAEELVELKDALDEAAMASLGPDVLDRFRSVRADYRVYRDLMKNSVIDEHSGDVSLRQLSNVLRKSDEAGFRRGRKQSDLYDAAAYERSYPPLPGMSPTARLQSLPQTVIASSMIGGGAYASGEGGLESIGAAAGLPLSMLLFGKYYNSPAGRRHFGKGFLPPISDEFRRHLGQQIGRAATAASAQGQLPPIMTGPR